MIERDRCTIFMEFNSWCLQLLHEFNPFVFARSLATTFDIATIDKDGKPEHIAPGDVSRVHASQHSAERMRRRYRSAAGGWGQAPPSQR